MAHIPFESTASLMRAYSEVAFETTKGGTPVAIFRNPDSQPVAYSTGSFCASGGSAILTHDVHSLERFLRYNSPAQDLCPIDYARWTSVLDTLKTYKKCLGNPRMTAA